MQLQALLLTDRECLVPGLQRRSCGLHEDEVGSRVGAEGFICTAQWGHQGLALGLNAAHLCVSHTFVVSLLLCCWQRACCCVACAAGQHC